MNTHSTKLWVILFLLVERRIAGLHSIGCSQRHLRISNHRRTARRTVLPWGLLLPTSTLSRSLSLNMEASTAISLDAKNSTSASLDAPAFMRNNLEETPVPNLDVTVEQDRTSTMAISKETATPKLEVTVEQDKSSTPARAPTPPRQQQQTAVAPLIHNFASRQEFLQALDDNLHHRGQQHPCLLVVKYHAHYCRICQRSSITFRKVAHEYHASSGTATDAPILFTRLEASAWSADDLRALGLTKFPFVQIYRRGNCVASFSTGPSHLFTRRVRDTLNACLQRTQQEWEDLERHFATEIEQNHQARQVVRQRLEEEQCSENGE